MIGIRGIFGPNKGSCLMLAAITQHFAASGREAELCLDHCRGRFAETLRLGLVEKYWCSRPFPSREVLAELLLPSLCGRHNLVKNSQVKAVLDASGFAYGDQWGELGVEKARELLRQARRWKRQEKKLVLLPQAFGPFENPLLREAFKEAAAYVDLIFARDSQSFAYLRELIGERPELIQAPDFTALVEGASSAAFPLEGQAACVIPNTKMFSMQEAGQGNGQRESYQTFLLDCIRGLQKRELKPFLLIHEQADRSFAEQLAAECDDLPLMEEEDPLLLKGIIGRCRLAVSSRFHGIVSALSQGVPCIATGWSHKYEELLVEYNCADMVVAVPSDPGRIRMLLDSLADEEDYESRRLSILKAAEAQKDRSRTMWQRVDAVVESD